MADVAVQHTMVTPAGTVVFNDGSLDQYYLNATPGLDGVPARVAVSKVPYGHGARWHAGWRDGRRFQPTGTLLIQSTRVQNEIVEIRNDMEETLRAAHESLLDGDGTWSWTPLGGTERTLVIYRDEQEVAYTHVDNYAAVDFTFGLIAPDPDWT